jgi:type II secretion system protein I
VDWNRCIWRRLLRAAGRQAGFSLIEVLIAMTIFAIVATSMIGVVSSATTSDGLARQKTIALELAQQQIEYVRQLSYANVGTAGGNPPGSVLPTQSKKVSGLWYEITTHVKSVNDPIATSNVLYAHYKQVTVVVSRKPDSKQLATVTTYVSSPTKGAFNKGVITVTVKDYFTDEPLGGATVELKKTWDAGFSGGDQTDDDPDSSTYGQATFAGLEPTPEGDTDFYEVTASLPGYSALTDDLPPNEAADLPLAPSGTSTTTLHLYKKCTLNVRIIDGDNQPSLYTDAVDVTLSSASRSATSVQEGVTGGETSFDTLGSDPDLEDLPPGWDYEVSVDASVAGGFRHGETSGVTLPENEEEYSLPNPSRTVEVTLESLVIPRTATITIEVRRDSCSGSLEANANVVFNPSPPTPKSTSSNGRAVFANVALGTYQITASKRIHGRNYYGPAAGSSYTNPYTVTGDATLCIAISR